MQVTLTHNAQQFAMQLRSDARELRDVAMMRALNGTAEQVKTAASREVRAAGYGLKASVVKDAIRIKRATTSNLVATVVASGKPIALIHYSARQTAQGVTVSVLKGRKSIRGAFIATMPSGHRGVFVRKPGSVHRKVAKGGKAVWSQLPIRELFGPSVPDGLANAAVQRALQALVAEKLPVLLAREARWLASRGGRR